MYSLRAGKRNRLWQRHDFQNIILTPCYYKNIYRKVRYVYFYENIFQDKSIHIIFTFANSTILKLLMIYISNVWPKTCPKLLLLPIRREYNNNENSVWTWGVAFNSKALYARTCPPRFESLTWYGRSMAAFGFISEFNWCHSVVEIYQLSLSNVFVG